MSGHGKERKETKGLRLTDIFIRKFVTESYSLRLMLDRFAVNNGLAELFDDGLVNGITLQVRRLVDPWVTKGAKVSTYEIFDGTSICT